MLRLIFDPFQQEARVVREEARDKISVPNHDVIAVDVISTAHHCTLSDHTQILYKTIVGISS